MAEAGPSNGPSTSDPRSRSHVQFSDDQASSGAELPAKSSRTDSPLSRKSHPSKQGDLHMNADERRRVRVSAANVNTSPLGLFPVRRSIDAARGPGGLEQFGFGLEAASDVFGLSALSDEYDLSNEDPKILKDVQNALKLKARREARLQGLPVTSPSKDTSARTPSLAETSILPAAQRPIFPLAKPQPQFGTSTSSDIDFSPSTGTASLHPVPMSSNGGATLDWTGQISRTKSKDKILLASKAIVEKQDSIFTDKISRIRSEANAQTLSKAVITSKQLQRRYDVLFKSLKGPVAVNPAGAARWYDISSAETKQALDEAEPLTWLRHLLDKKGRANCTRLPWHLTALIVEEYAKARGIIPETMEVIPEDTATPSPKAYKTQATPPAIFRSGPSSESSPNPSMMRHSSDGHVSFKPYIESTRNSVEGESRRSADNHLKAWRRSLPGVADSPHSSTYSDPSVSSVPRRGQSDPTASPSPLSNNRLQIRDFTNRIRRRPYASDDGSSSAQNSASEDQSRSDDIYGTRKRAKRHSRPINLSLTPAFEPEAEVEPEISNQTTNAEVARDPGGNPPVTLKVRPVSHENDGESTAVRQDFQREEGLEPDVKTPRAPILRKGARISLPSGRLFKASEERRHHTQHDSDEENEQHEYELKARMLDDAVARNHRIRLTLQHIATSVREYDNIQNGLMSLLRVPHTGIPSELLDAFSHDPAAVTGATRRYRGWKAVDDIHNRIARQRETFAAFNSMATEDACSAPHTVFADPIAALSQTLDVLEVRRQETVVKAREVAGILTRVKGMHASTKTEYNETLSHTSVVYPELSQIVALEESYKDQYQQLWEFGMDTLTFILDTVTPFWRNYGKTIGEDVRDFLIIPLYRNEFTGEAKRYPIEHIPTRSFFHWIGLLLFFNIAFTSTIFQARLVFRFISFYRLPWSLMDGIRWIVMPFFWVAVLAQFCAVLVELAIVLAQVGVVVWWFGWLLKVVT